MTSPNCSTCNVPVAAGMYSGVRLPSGQWATWRECWGCFSERERREAQDRNEIERERLARQEKQQKQQQAPKPKKKERAA